MISAFSINPNYPSINISSDALRQIPDDKNIKMWNTITEYNFKELGKRINAKCRIMITWTSLENYPAFYEPLCELDDNGSPTRYLSGQIQPDYSYVIPDTESALESQIRPVSILNTTNGWIYQIPFSTMCCSNTLFNMIGDCGSFDDTPIPLSSEIINGQLFDTLQLFLMMRIMGNPDYKMIINNWKNTNEPLINNTIRIPLLDSKVFKTPEPESTWIDFDKLLYLIRAIDYLDIHPMTMYITYIYSEKISENNFEF